MKNVIGMISANYFPGPLAEIAEKRPVAAIPFGGRYRLLDFSLSSLVNSGIRTVGMITPFHYRAILDHLGAGKEWMLDRKTEGLFILPGQCAAVPDRFHKFTLQDMGRNIEFLVKSSADYVIISGCNLVFNLNFKEVLEFHHRRGGDVTLIYKEVSSTCQEEGAVLLETEGEHGRVEGFRSLDNRLPGQLGNCFMDIMVIGRRLLIERITACQEDEATDLFDLIRKDEGLKVYAYPAKGYMSRISSIPGYFQTSMELLNPEIRAELFMGPDRIHTKIKDNPPARYGSEADVRNSLISSGCRIEGKVEDSILSRDVFVERGAEVRNCIIMQECSISRGTVLEGVILDKFVQVREDAVLRGDGIPKVVRKLAMV